VGYRAGARAHGEGGASGDDVSSLGVERNREGTFET
jgi:hypothetical protein